MNRAMKRYKAMKRLHFKWFLWKQGLWKKYKNEFYKSYSRKSTDKIDTLLRETPEFFWISLAVEHDNDSPWHELHIEWVDNKMSMELKDIILRALTFFVVSILGGAVLASLFIVLRTVITGG